MKFAVRLMLLFILLVSPALSAEMHPAMYSLAPMLDRVLPAVVNIHVEGLQPTRKLNLPREFRHFFGPEGPGKGTRQFEGLGSGVIIDSGRGYVVTNSHVVSGADKIRVQLNDGREFDANLVGQDEQTDLALIRLVSFKDLTEIRMADSDQLRVGDFTVAVGNPFGLGQTATSGIVSALGRSGLSLEGLENFIQTDASINRGNSGGALVNLRGELIGINAAILAPGGGNVGIGFAIPSNIVRNLSTQLIKFGKIKRGQLGIKGLELTSDMARSLNVDVQRGAFVSEVVPRSAAARANIKAGDIIVSVEERPIQSFAELRARIGTTSPGRTVRIGILRGKKVHTTSVTLDGDPSSSRTTGVSLSALPGVILGNTLLKDGTRGVRVEELAGDLPAALSELRRGDVIVELNGKRVRDLGQLRRLLNFGPPAVILGLLRDGARICLVLR